MSSSNPPRKRLDLWKGIADYLNCSDRTAKRYAARGMPVYRVGGRTLQRVFAYADELDHWIRDGTLGLPKADPQLDEGLDDGTEELSKFVHEVDSVHLRLDVIEGAETGASHVVNQPTTIIGRGVDAAIIFPDPRVSRQHARITRNGSTYRIEDLQSRNGTFVNGKALHQRRLLRHGDVVQLGGAVSLRVNSFRVGETADAVVR